MKAAASKKRPPPPGPFPASLLAGSRYNDRLFWRGFRHSAIAHGALVVTGIIMSFVVPHEPIKFLPSIRVDLVGLPDFKKSDMNKIAPDDMTDLNKKLSDAGKSAKKLLQEAKKAPAPPEESDMTLKKEKPANKKDELKSAIDRIKALEDIESQVKKGSKEKPKAVLKGNALSKGNSVTGEQAADTNMYIGKLQGRLRDNWNLPVWLTKQDLNAKVVIFLDRGGYVSHTVLAKSSGNQQFDDYCLKTIRMAQPFGPPPSDILDGGITLGFPL
jgi:outer membrane biosynthesis protein TonB